MSKIADKAAELSKSVEAFCGSVIMFGTSLLAFTDQMPDKVGIIVIGVVGAFTTFRVWLVRNEKLIRDVADAGEDLYQNAREVWPPDQPVDQYGEHARPQ